METLVDLAALSSWMDRQGLGHGPLTDIVRLAGGTQNILLKFSRSGRAYVLRRPPPVLRANSNETMRREARDLRSSLVRAFNDGFSDTSDDYRICDTDAVAAEARLAGRGKEIATRMATHYFPKRERSGRGFE